VSVPRWLKAYIQIVATQEAYECMDAQQQLNYKREASAAAAATNRAAKEAEQRAATPTGGRKASLS